MEKDLHDYRKSYEKNELKDHSLLLDPMMFFKKWFAEVETEESLAEINTMNLATIGPDGFPKNRVVLLKSFNDEGFVFYTNYNSEKGESIKRNPRVCLSFFWPNSERQVIVKGIAEKTSEDDSTEYFHSRPWGSRLGAWASSQSEAIASRTILEAKIEELKEKYKEGKVPRPPHWGGYLVRPESLEFWQGRENRLHDRFLYSKNIDGNWKIHRLAP